MLNTRLISLCCNQTPKNWKLGTCPFTVGTLVRKRVCLKLVALIKIRLHHSEGFQAKKLGDPQPMTGSRERETLQATLG
jgi:hypothetical protein